jgi:hypothetical protein
MLCESLFWNGCEDDLANPIARLLLNRLEDNDVCSKRWECLKVEDMDPY